MFRRKDVANFYLIKSLDSMFSSSILQFCLFISGIAVGVGATSALTSLVKRLALHWNLVDKPNHRSVHKTPIPRVGGIAIVGGFFVSMLYFYLLRLVFEDASWIISFPKFWIIVGAVMMFLVGLADDILNLKASVKLYFQCLAAFIIVAAGYRFEVGFLYFEELGPLNDLTMALFTFFWILGIINAVNLMDGMDGLAAGTSVIAVSCLTVALALNGYGADIVLVTAFIAALLGFLMHNSYPATIFMGDSGSLFLGFILATFSLPATSATVGPLPYVLPVLVLGLPILDTLTAIVRRASKGQGIFSADKDHIHHRVFRSHRGQQRAAVITLYAINMAFGIMAILFISASGIQQAIWVLGMAICMVIFFLFKLGYIPPIINMKDYVRDGEVVEPDEVSADSRS